MSLIVWIGKNIIIEYCLPLKINKFGQLKTNFIVSLMIIIPISLMTIVKTNLHFIFLTSLLVLSSLPMGTVLSAIFGKLCKIAFNFFWIHYQYYVGWN